MRAVVVGAGAWGLPAGAELARRGHDVTVIDRFAVGNAQASSGGPTRIWRLAHPDRESVRLAQSAVEAWRRLERRTETTLLLERGLLWRGPNAVEVAGALAAEGVAATWVEAGDVRRYFEALRPGRWPAVWQAEAGPVLAADALAAAQSVLVRAGGRLETGRWVHDIEVGADGVRVGLGDGYWAYEADVVVLAPGPWAGALLGGLGIDLDLTPVLEQVGYVDGPGNWETWPCLIDTEGPGFGTYAMPTPGLGYKLGNDVPLRVLTADDGERTADPVITADLETYVSRSLVGLVPTVTRTQVCSWTNSADGKFVIDRIHDGRVVIACGDSGQGFKFLALMGEVLADLAEGRTPSPDVAALGLARLQVGSS